jgi:serine/threonine protein kinase
MAPEMVIMLSQASYEKTGYTCAVDWWSLGVTMFKLLTGALRVHISFMLLLSSFVATPVYDC